jgi:Na+/H+-dicarboxylate symporter
MILLKKSKIAPHWVILFSVAFAIVCGIFTTPDTAIFGIKPLPLYDFFGALFLRSLKMLVVPLIVSAVITSVANAGINADFGRLGFKAIAYYTMTTVVAVLTGLFFANLINPGIIDGKPAKDLIGLSASTADVMSKVAGRTGSDLWGVFLRMVPENIIESASKSDMLALMTFSILFGCLVTRLPTKLAEAQLSFWQGVFDVMIAMTGWVMILAPIGVFGLVAKTISVTGFAAFQPLAYFFLAVVAGLGTHMFIILPTFLWFLGGKNPWKHFKAMSEALLMAFTTSSSNATLPKTLECLETKAKVPRRIVGFVVPLGATINMDGSALYECVAAMFIAQCYGLDLSFGTQFVIVILALLTSMGVSGIPSASLVAIAVILAAVGLPAEGLGLILAVDRILDMCRTSVNVFSDSCGAAIIAGSEERREKKALASMV